MSLQRHSGHSLVIVAIVAADVAVAVALAVSGGGCTVEHYDEARVGAADVDDADDEAALANAAEDAGGDEPGLCERLTQERGALGSEAIVDGRRLHVITGTQSGERIEGTPGPDLIFGLGGDDKIFGKGGNDVICAGGDADFVDGGLGQDRIYGEGGRDVLHGGGAGDWIHGGDGDDEVFGDLLDDKLYGADGDDLLVGSHGTDHMEGGAGDDWLRGDTNGDTFIGGPGAHDVVSFMTARPTGRAVRGARFVMDVDLAQDRADGDGFAEPVRGVEKIIGSTFDDRFVGGGAVEFVGGLGSDRCNARACDTEAEGGERGVEELPLPFVYVDARPRDTGVIVIGSPGDDSLVFKRHDDGAVIVRETRGRALHAGGARCEQTTASMVVTCHPQDRLRYLMAWGGDGDDELRVGAGFPRDFTAHVDGGDGNDDITGSDAGDVLFSGRSGRDVLDGLAGDDALISEAYDDDRERSGREHQGGADTLLGRGGNDQLVSDYPCGGHFYSGGRGVDIAGFARVGDRKIHAQLRGPVADADRAAFFGKAFLPGVCSVDDFGTELAADLEILEGSKGDDVLLGNDRRNVIWGRQGNDVVKGFGGDDAVYGHEGNDDVFGGAGDDVEQE